MERVRVPEQHPVSGIPHVAVAIKANSLAQRHIGVLHRSVDGDQVRLLHLAWHCDLRNDDPKSSYIWIDLPIDPLRAKQVAAMCRKIWRSNGAKHIPYALRFPNDCFDAKTGAFLIGKGTLGLTCATFVLALFQSCGLAMVDLATWQNREDDLAWQEQCIQELEKSKADRGHIEAITTEIGCIRFRPEDVAGAAANTPWPVAFAQATQMSSILVDLLLSRLKDDR